MLDGRRFGNAQEHLIRRLCRSDPLPAISLLTCRDATHWCAVVGGVERRLAAKMGQRGLTTWMRATSELIQSIAGKHIKVLLFGHIQATFGVVPNMNSFDFHSVQP